MSDNRRRTPQEVIDRQFAVLLLQPFLRPVHAHQQAMVFLRRRLHYGVADAERETIVTEVFGLAAAVKQLRSGLRLAAIGHEANSEVRDAIRAVERLDQQIIAIARSARLSEARPDSYQA